MSSAQAGAVLLLAKPFGEPQERSLIATVYFPHAENTVLFNLSMFPEPLVHVRGGHREDVTAR